MNPSYGTILEVQQTLDGSRKAVILWPEGKRPLPGQYLQAYHPAEPGSPAPVTLFLGGLADPGLGSLSWVTAPTIPATWNPQDQVLLRGPLGTGFNLPETASRIALAAFGSTTDYLLPLAEEALVGNREVAIFTDDQFPQLPASIEVSPLSALADGIRWAEYLAASTPLEMLSSSQTRLDYLGAAPGSEVLVLSPMPCGALGACGVCALRSDSGKTLLVCEEGPVFPLGKL